MKWGAAVSPMDIARLIVDHSRYSRLLDDVLKLRAADLLTEWEGDFASSLPAKGEPTPRQVFKLLQIWAERRPIYESGGVLVRTILNQLREIRLDLDEDDEACLDEVCARDVDFLQLADLNRVAWIAQKHDFSFPPIRREYNFMSDISRFEVEEIVAELRVDSKPRRASKRVGRAPPARGLRHRAADLSGLRDALDRLGAAVAADCAAKAVRA